MALGTGAFPLENHAVVSGRLGWRARHLKEVDAQELTLRFWQEIYDEQGKLQLTLTNSRGICLFRP
ncbi:MAG: hypothetical protein HY695_19255 [Deltaproteobacteria bacterium]|nr:hypothetical protein [Deltaproteobacteria bacterium]